MERRLAGCGLALLVAVLPGCGSSAGNTEVDAPQARLRSAWVGQADGLLVLAEELAPPQQPTDSILSEESMLRQRLGLDDAGPMLRLHLVGTAQQLLDAGQLSSGSHVFSAFGRAPQGFLPDQRLLWSAILQGGPPPADAATGTLLRRFILAGPPGAVAGSSMAWASGDLRVDLKQRRWSEKTRRAWFDQAMGQDQMQETVQAPEGQSPSPSDPDDPPVPAREDDPPDE